MNMKTSAFHPFFYCFIFPVLLLINGCGKDGKSRESENAAAFDSVKVPVYSGATAIGITHEVKNFDDWLKVYDAESDPQARISVYASPDDPNLVTVFELTKSHADAKNVFASDRIKNAMKVAGVTSEPVYHYYDIKYRSSTKTEKLYRVGISHEVEEYERWKKVFDEDEPTRSKANLELRAVTLDAENPHMVNIMFATDDIAKAKEVINSDELRRRMQEAGVRSEPVFTVLTVTKQP